jgi:hypothetical protein
MMRPSQRTRRGRRLLIGVVHEVVGGAEVDLEDVEASEGDVAEVVEEDFKLLGTR